MASRDFSPARDLTLELSIGEAALGYDFTVQEHVDGQGYILPRFFIMTDGGVLVFVDADGKSRTIHAEARRVYPATIQSVTTATGSGFVQFFAGPVGGI